MWIRRIVNIQQFYETQTEGYHKFQNAKKKEKEDISNIDSWKNDHLSKETAYSKDGSIIFAKRNRESRITILQRNWERIQFCER